MQNINIGTFAVKVTQTNNCGYCRYLFYFSHVLREIQNKILNRHDLSWLRFTNFTFRLCFTNSNNWYIHKIFSDWQIEMTQYSMEFSIWPADPIC